MRSSGALRRRALRALALAAAGALLALAPEPARAEEARAATVTADEARATVTAAEARAATVPAGGPRAARARQESTAPASAEVSAPRPPARAPRAAHAARPARLDLRVTFRPWESGGTFRLETSDGASDHGSARDLGGFSAAGGGVRRVLEGEKGTLVLRLQGGPRPGQPPVFGRWTLASGTGAYAGMTGSGTFTALSGGDRRGVSPYELQFLVGTVLHGG